MTGGLETDKEFVVWQRMGKDGLAAVQLVNREQTENKDFVLLSSISLQCSSNQLVVVALGWRGGA